MGQNHIFKWVCDDLEARIGISIQKKRKLARSNHFFDGFEILRNFHLDVPIPRVLNDFLKKNQPINTPLNWGMANQAAKINIKLLIFVQFHWTKMVFGAKTWNGTFSS